MPKEKWEEDFDYLSFHARKYLAETPPPRIVFFGNTWWLPDLTMKPAKESKRECFNFRKFFFRRTS